MPSDFMRLLGSFKVGETTLAFPSRRTHWDELQSRDADRLAVTRVQYVIGYASFGCFLLGGGFGLFALLCA